MVTKNRRILSTLSIFFIFFISIQGKGKNYLSFKNIFSYNEANNVRNFAQDKQGLIWIGTNKGLLCYDGFFSQAHFPTKGNGNALVHSILVYNDSLFFLGTDKGIQIYNYRTDKYRNNHFKFSEDIRALNIKDGLIWIGTLNGLFTYNPQTERLINISRNKKLGLANNTIYSILKTRNNELYIGTYNGLYHLLNNKNKFDKVDLPLDKKRSNIFVNSLFEDKRTKTIWIGTEGALYKYIPTTKEVEEIKLFHGNSIKSIAMDKSKDLLVGTDNGLYIYNDEEKTFFHYMHDSRNNTSLINNVIWNVFVDKENNIWLGTENGISLLQFNNSLQSIPIASITGIGDGNKFYTIFKDSKKNFWLGGTNGLILTNSLTNSKGKAIWYKMGDTTYPISHNRIRSIYEDSDNDLWVTTDGSINRYDYKKKQFIHYNIVDATGTFNTNWAYYIFEDKNKRLWITTYLGGIFIVDKNKLLHSSDTYIANKNYTTKDGLSGNFVTQIEEDKIGNIWVLLSNKGINKINTVSGHIEKFTVKNMEQLRNPSLMLRDSNGFIWIGATGCLAKINPANNHTDLLRFGNNEQSELLAIEEINKNIWLSTTDGIWSINKYSFQAKRLNIPNKSYTCIFYNKDEKNIYLGGTDEIAVISDNVLNNKINNYPIILTGLYINNKLLGSDNIFRGESIRYLSHLELNYNENNLTFEFSDLDYSNNGGDKYAYQLEGMDNIWNMLKQNSNQINFSNLASGNYILKIAKLDAYGKPTIDVKAFSFRINPPWYFSLIAKIIYGILFLSFTLWIINFFQVKHNLRIERIEKEKTVELTNLKLEFFTNVSHEFKTPLSLIIAPVSKLIAETKDSIKKRQLENIQRNALKLNSLIRQVLDFNSNENNLNQNLVLAKLDFVQFAQSLFSMFKEDYKNKKLHFSFQTNIEKIFLMADTLKMETMLNNLLSNACKFTEESGDIGLTLNYLENKQILEIKVSDTGIGVPANELNYIFERYYQSSKTAKLKEGSGIGLYLVKKYAEQHKGSVHIESVENKGTTITISLPVFTDSLQIEQKEEFMTEKNSDKPRILIVEDEVEIAEFISNLLSNRYVCQIANNGKAGLELAETFHPELIISDIMMPVMDGLEMIRRMKKNTQTAIIPIILLTAKDDRNTELESLNLHIDAFVSKPFDTELLLLKIEQLIIRKQQLTEKMRLETIATPQEMKAESNDEKFLSEIINIIEKKLTDSDLNVNVLSEISGISSKQIYRKTKQLTALSPVEFIRSIRLKKAAMLLSQKKFTVAEVMYMVGFSNHSYFSKCFQAEFGKTPKQYLEEQQQMDNPD